MRGAVATENYRTGSEGRVHNLMEERADVGRGPIWGWSQGQSRVRVGVASPRALNEGAQERPWGPPWDWHLRPTKTRTKGCAPGGLARYYWEFMGRSPSQTSTAAQVTPGRAAISGLSLLMLVAIAVQASAGLMTPAVQARQHSGLPVVRYIAEAMTRQAERQVRRQEERPALLRTCSVVVRAAKLDMSVERVSLDVRPRRLMVMLTNLPPPRGMA